jgi:16S rRNA (cytosine967-C5)-methyltransferase
MSRYYSYLNTAKEIASNYKGDMPLSIWLKQFFATRKQMGSRDRREVASLVYQYYRLGWSVDAPFEETISIAIFLCSTEPNELLKILKPEWNDKIDLPINKKLGLVEGFNLNNLFPFIDGIGEEIDKTAFTLSHLIQPDLFIRIRPNHYLQVKQKLTTKGIAFTETDENCLSINNSTGIDAILNIDMEAVIQDYSSQQAATFLKPLIGYKKGLKVWDCCAASGGKSIMAVDVLGNIDLTVSDVRQSIIQNLKKRFQRAGISKYNALVADISKPTGQLKGQTFDLIICDAPCSGSGTWGRAPENLIHFKKESINLFSTLQKKIVSNTIRYLASNGYFLYITCSVYKEENEAVVSFIQDKFPKLQLQSKALIEGYKKNADTMFAALFIMASY